MVPDHGNGLEVWSGHFLMKTLAKGRTHSLRGWSPLTGPSSWTAFYGLELSMSRFRSTECESIFLWAEQKCKILSVRGQDYSVYKKYVYTYLYHLPISSISPFKHSWSPNGSVNWADSFGNWADAFDNWADSVVNWGESVTEWADWESSSSRSETSFKLTSRLSFSKFDLRWSKWRSFAVIDFKDSASSACFSANSLAVAPSRLALSTSSVFDSVPFVAGVCSEAPVNH